MNKLKHVLTMAMFSLGFTAYAEPAKPSLDFTTEVIVNKLASPWAITLTPQGHWLITEREGNVVTVTNDGIVTRQKLALPSLYVEGQGGLMDIKLAPDFKESRALMISYAKGDESENRLAVMKGKLSAGGEIEGLETVFEVKDAKDTPVHYGGRLLALNENEWLVTSGDGFDYREEAQKLSSQLGKVLRFDSNGSALSDNTFADAPFIFTYGHRNPQGLIQGPHGEIWLHEHGPDGGDEINQLHSGNNYGWPVVTNGNDYSGARISPFRRYEGMHNPVWDWTPSIAPSAMIYYSGARFPTLSNTLLVTALKDKAVYAVSLEGQHPSQQRIFSSLDTRLRDIATDDEGYIYLLTDGANASLMRVRPGFE